MLRFLIFIQCEDRPDGRAFFVLRYQALQPHQAGVRNRSWPISPCSKSERKMPSTRLARSREWLVLRMLKGSLRRIKSLAAGASEGQCLGRIFRRRLGDRTSSLFASASPLLRARIPKSLTFRCHQIQRSLMSSLSLCFGVCWRTSPSLTRMSNGSGSSLERRCEAAKWREGPQVASLSHLGDGR